MKHCTACGARLADGARFCGECGARLGAASAPPDPDATIPTPAGDLDPDATTPSPLPLASPRGASRSPHGPSRSSAHSSSAPPSAEGVYAPGTLIDDRYRIVGLLGRGGMGEVYRADDLTLGQSVALKFLPESVGHSHDRRERFMNEVRTAREVAHPNVCRVYDIGEVDERVFLSMEYIDGEDLSSLLRRIGRLPQEKAIEIARSLCAGLGALHDRGVLHRDLKPANVMIDGRGRVRITDFGLSGVGMEVRGAEARAGTPAYMAPEQLDGERADERSDIYALGVTLYEVFTGRRPFEANSVAEISRMQRSGTPPSASTLVPDLDESVERVLQRCLDPDADRRPPSAYAVAAALPGGDPLAAALAAGEVPSIEMVAAAGKTGGVRPLIGVLCLFAAIAGVVLYAGWGTQRATYHWDAMEKPPAVLQERAREILASVGIEEPPGDETTGYLEDARALRWVAELDSAETDWSRLREKRPAALHFWYRRSPEHLRATRPEQMSTYDDPPMAVSGMVRLKLDTRGRLLDFEAVPVQYAKRDTAGAVADTDAAEAPPPVDWSVLLAAAGFDPAELRDAEPEWTPAAYADERVAWRGTLPEDPEVEIRLEGAAYQGRPVAFRLIGDWSRAERMPTGSASGGDFAIEATIIALLVAILAAMVILALRNVRNGRGDKPGARRLSIVVFCGMMVAWLFRTNHGTSPSGEINMFFEAVAQGLLACGLFWTAYLALEPLVRSTWPGRLVGWSRLLTGRWNDPLVGRDILAGAVFFFVMIAIGVGRIHLQDAMGLGAPRPSAIDDGIFLGVANTISSLASLALNSVFNGLFFFLLLLLLRMICRKMPITIVVWILLFVATFWATRNGPERGPAPYVGLVVSLVWLVMMLRYGMLAFIVGFFFRQLVYQFPMTLDTSVWYAGTSWFAAAIVVGITALGLKLALSARPSPGDLYDR